MKISMKSILQIKIAIFFNFSPTSSHFHPLQVENCDSNSRLVVDEDDNGKLRPEKVITPGNFTFDDDTVHIINVAPHISTYKHYTKL